MLNLDKLSLEEMLGYQRVGVAFSGGVDSHVLLHFLTKKLHKHTNLFALHINHGINDQSNLWERHCKEICNSLGVNFVSFKLSFMNVMFLYALWTPSSDERCVYVKYQISQNTLPASINAIVTDCYSTYLTII